MIDKIFWFVRLIIYSPFFGRVKLPSYIGKPISIIGFRKIFIGKNVRIYPNVRLEVHGKGSKLIINDNVGIAQNVHITTAGLLEICPGTTILANTFITDIDHLYEDIKLPVLEQGIKVKATRIGENCFIGMGAAIQAGTKLGNHCIVGSNSVVRGTFDDYSVIVGAPAKVVKKYNLITQKWERTDPKGNFI